MNIDNINELKGLLSNLNETECNTAIKVLEKRKKELENIKRRDIMIELRIAYENAKEALGDCIIAEVGHYGYGDDGVKDVYISDVLDYIQTNYI